MWSSREFSDQESARFVEFFAPGSELVKAVATRATGWKHSVIADRAHLDRAIDDFNWGLGVSPWDRDTVSYLLERFPNSFPVLDISWLDPSFLPDGSEAKPLMVQGQLHAYLERRSSAAGIQELFDLPGFPCGWAIVILDANSALSPTGSAFNVQQLASACEAVYVRAFDGEGGVLIEPASAD